MLLDNYLKLWSARTMPPTTSSIWVINRKATIKRAIGLVLMCAFFSILAASDFVHQMLLSLMANSERVIESHKIMGAFLFVLLAAISAMIAFVSVVVIIPVAVYTWGGITTLVLLWLGWILGGMLAYSIARHFGRKVVQWFTAEKGLKRVESYINQQTPFSLVLLFQIALPSELPGYVLGLVRYPLKSYLTALALAELPFAIASVTLGESFINKQSTALLCIGLVIVAFSTYAIFQLHKRVQEVSNTDQQ